MNNDMEVDSKSYLITSQPKWHDTRVNQQQDWFYCIHLLFVCVCERECLRLDCIVQYNFWHLNAPSGIAFVRYVRVRARAHHFNKRN